MSKVNDLLKDLQHIKKQRDNYVVGDNKVQRATEHFTVPRHYSVWFFAFIILLVIFLIGGC